jgi:preprotein translocase subunit SecD
MKNTKLLIRTAIIIAVTLIGIYLVIGPRGAITSKDFTYAGIKDNLAQNINLGLDLKGGSHLVMRVKTEEYLKKLTDTSSNAALLAAQEANPPLPATGVETISENGTYQFTLNLSDASKAQQVIDTVKQKVDLANWSEDNNGSSITWSLSTQTQRVLKQQAAEQAMQIIKSRIDAFGVKEPTLQEHGATGSGQILLQMPGVDDPERVKKLIGEESKLSLMKVVSPPNPSPVQTFETKEAAIQSLGGTVPANRLVVEYLEREDPIEANKTPPEDKKNKWVIVEYPPIIDGSELRDASAVTRTGNISDYQISFSLKPAGAKKFGEWTGKNINNYMGVVLDNKVKSIAFIKSQIFDQGQIDGNFTKESGDDLALTLKSGALPAEIVYQEERTVGPSLGADSIRAGVQASAGGLLFVILFMLFYYRGSGINAVVALVLNMLLTLAALILLKSTLTLPGIAGLILGIGMAVDSNVLIFERMREEIKEGKTIKKSIEIGFDKAFITIIDTHLTTIISAIILYLFGTGPIRGFAVTLILGLLINLFSAVFVSKTIFYWLLERNPDKKTISI